MLRILLVGFSLLVQLQAGPLGRRSSSSRLELQLSNVFTQVAREVKVDSSPVAVVPESDPAVNDLTKKNQDVNFEFQSLQNDIATLYSMSSGQTMQSGPMELNQRLRKFQSN